MFKLNPFTGEFDQVGGILVESLPTNFLADSVIFSDGSTLVEDNPGFTYVPGSGLSLDDGIFLIDNAPVTFGTGNDATILYDGTDLQIKPDAVGTGVVNIAGELRLANHNTSTLILYIGSDNNIEADSEFTFNPSTQTLGVNKILATGAIQTDTTGRFDDGIIDSNSDRSVDSENRELETASGVVSAAWSTFLLNDGVAVLSHDWGSRILHADDGVDAILNYSTVGTAEFGDSIINTTGNLNAAKGTFAAAGVALDVQNTTDPASGQMNEQVAIFRGSDRTPAVDGDTAYLSFFLDDSAGTQAEFARIDWRARDVSSGSKDTEFRIYARRSNSLQEMFSISSTASSASAIIFNEGSVDTDFRVETNNNSNMFFLNGGTDIATFGSATSLAMLGVDGFADEIQFLVQGHSTQTNLLVTFEQSDGTDVFTCSNAGAVFILSDLEIDGALNHDGSTIGFFATTPAVQVAAYTPTNVTPDRAYDADSTTVDELADVLGTLISDLQTYGLLQ